MHINKSTLTDNEKSIIANRLITIINAYDSRENTISGLAEKTGLKYNQIQKILSDYNFYHGIKRNTGTASHPLNLVIKYDDFRYLIDCTEIDHMRREKERR